MGNCLRKCFGRFDRRRTFLQTRYSLEKEVSIEDDVQNEMSKQSGGRTSQHQHAILKEDEERIRREEEAYYEAKREAARIAQLRKKKEETAKAQSNGPKSWSMGEDGEWEVAGGEDDFEMFLESVRARSLKATAHLRNESNDGRSTNSSSTPTQLTRDRSHTEGSNSIELEWDHDEDVGIIPVRKQRSSTDEDLSYLVEQEPRDSPSLSAELEWDADFTAADDADTLSLLGTNYKQPTSAS